MAGALESVIVLQTTSARAERPSVAIWLAGPEDAQKTEIENRLRGELALAGFDSRTLAGSFGEGAASLERAARSAGSVAAIGVVRTGSLEADVWVTDRVTGKAVLRHVRFTADSSDAPAIFALRAVELLHASFLEIGETHPSRGEVRAPPELDRWVTREPAASARAAYEAWAGAVLAFAPGGVPAAFAPDVGFAWRPLTAWAGGIEAWGPAASHVHGKEGNAQVDQEAVFTFMRFEPIASRTVLPFVRVGFGAARLGVSGESNAPFTSLQNHVWSTLGTAGLGVRLSSHSMALDAGMDALWLSPQPAVVFVNRDAATTGAPTLTAKLALSVVW